MLAPIFSDPAFNQGFMDTQQKLREAIAKGSSAVSVSAISSAKSTVSTPDPSTFTPSSSESKSTKVSTSEATVKPDDKESKQDSSNSQKEESPTSTKELNAQELRYISTLQEIDRRVRAHEQAHLNAAQGLAITRANYAYELGPDKKRYAVAGEVSIDTSEENEPEKTIDKGFRIIRAAFAPADPSPQDHAVAAHAEQMIIDAQADLMRESYAMNQQSDEEQNSGQMIDQQV